MKIIRTIHDVRALMGANTLPKAYFDHVEEYFHDMYAAFKEDSGIEEFDLVGNEIVILERSDNFKGICLPMIPGSPDLLDMHPEYVDKCFLEGLEVYRIGIMTDNERMLTIFSQVGQFNQEVEEWLAEHWEWSQLYVEQ